MQERTIQLQALIDSNPKKILIGAGKTYNLSSALTFDGVTNMTIEHNGELLPIDGTSPYYIKGDSKNIKIFGTGVINKNGGTGRSILIENAKDIVIDGIQIIDSAGAGIIAQTATATDTISRLRVQNVTFENVQDICFSVDTENNGGYSRTVRLLYCDFVDCPTQNITLKGSDNNFIIGNSCEYSGSGQHAIALLGDSHTTTILGNHGFAQGTANELGLTFGKEGNLQNLNAVANIMVGNGISGDAFEVATGRATDADTRNINIASNISQNHINGFIIGTDNVLDTRYTNVSFNGNIVDSAISAVYTPILTNIGSNTGYWENMKISGNILYGKDNSDVASYGMQIRGHNHSVSGAGETKHVTVSDNLASNFGEGLRTRDGGLGYSFTDNTFYNNGVKGISYGAADTSVYLGNFALNNVINISHEIGTDNSLFTDFDLDGGSSLLKMYSPTTGGDTPIITLGDDDSNVSIKEVMALTPTATVPSSPTSGQLYMDDGTNTGGTPTLRYYNGTIWINL